MSRTREVVDRVGDRFPFPDDAFDRLARRRSRKQRNQRVSAAALALVLMLVAVAALVRVFGAGPIPADQPRPSPGPDLPRPSPTSEPTWQVKGGVYTVPITLTASTCSASAADRAITPRGIEFLAANGTDGWVAFDIGLLEEGHSFRELAAEMERAKGAGQKLDPVADRPEYFDGSLPGLVSHRFGGSSPTMASSLLHVGVAGSLSWSRQVTGRSSGTYAVICYQEAEPTGRFTPIGVAGPVRVGP